MNDPDLEVEAARLRLWTWAGFAIGVAAALVMAGLLVVGGVTTAGSISATFGAWETISTVLVGGAMFVGLTQLLWIVPFSVVAFLNRATRGLALGLLAGAAVVFLLNAACFGVVMASLSNF